MTLETFLETYDKKSSIVLLEGKREVLEEDKEKLVQLAELLTLRSKHIKFRSGNASGSDELFAQGVVSQDESGNRFEVVTPYSGHRKKQNNAYQTYNLDEINLAAEPEVVYESKKHKSTEKLIDKYLAGDKGRFAIKAAYIIRDTIKVIGADEIPPANFAIFYLDLKNPDSGGTGHTKNVCKDNNVPFIDQTTWFQWLEDNR